ncbi:MAG TPA: hypothetical protein VKR52_21030 [Terracidiphilus sp.]|nr:hypothetical protein [Terracidiphilus sp.]
MGSADKPAFELSKWYADCVTEQGDAIILYSAKLAWPGPTIHYTSVLQYRRGQPIRSRFSLRQQLPPEVRSDGSIAWKSKAWKAEGEWRTPDRALRETLYDSPDGKLEWVCLAPRSAARVCVERGEVFEGWGYAERLRLSLPPWRLPIRQLRWGRFINATDALVWIDWRGAYERQVVYHNGSAITARSICDCKIVLQDDLGELRLDTTAVLRQGALAKTALAVFPNLNRLFPASLLNVREQKFLSRAVLRRTGHPDSDGMAIHEVVDFP